MNEKVMKFAKLARYQVALETINSIDSENFQENFEKKFAQMIAQECANILIEKAKEYDQLAGREISAQTMDTAASLILQKFSI